MRIDRVKLITLLAEREIKQIELAQMAKVSRATISSVICGKSVAFETAQKISTALGVEPEELAQ